MSELPPSKSALKRQAVYLQQLGQRLTQLDRHDLEQLGLAVELVNAITDYQRFPSHGAKRRQLQYIGKLMRDSDADAIETQLQRLEGQSADARYAFHRLEQWREALLSEADALTRFIDAYPQVDRQTLRQLVKQVQTSPDERTQKQHARALFRYLREVAEQS